MTQIRFECPKCQQPMEAPLAARAEGVVCPACQTGFVPPDFQIVPSDGPAAAGDAGKTPFGPGESDRIKRQAGSVSQVGIGCFILAVIVLGVAVYRWMAENHWPAGASGTAAGFIVLALLLQIVAQLLHVRALLEEARGR